MRVNVPEPPARAAAPRGGSAASSAPSIELAHASFSYGGAPSLSDVTASIAPGEAVALIGPNGSGKSTLLKGIMGIVPLVSGSLRVLGTAPRQALRRVGYMPQTDELDPDFPVTLGQVVMMGRYRGIGWGRRPGKEDRRVVMEALDRVGLADQASRRFGDLSGGQQQRGILARALTVDPAILLLDEPFNGLDRTNRDALLATLNELRAAGVTVMTSTHDLELAREVCSTVMLLNRRVVACGPIETTLTLEKVERTFEGVGVEIDSHTVTTLPHGHGHEHASSHDHRLLG